MGDEGGAIRRRRATISSARGTLKVNGGFAVDKSDNGDGNGNVVTKQNVSELPYSTTPKERTRKRRNVQSDKLR